MEKTKNLIKIYKEGNKNIISDILNIYYPYIISISNKYNLHKTDYEDLYSSGKLALVKALNTCDITYDEKTLDTYIKKIIAREILRTTTTFDDIKHEKFKKIYIKYLAIKKKNNLSDKEIAKRMNITEEKLKYALDLYVEKLSIDLIDYEKELYLIDDKTDDVSREELINLISNLCLNKREKEALFLRFGLYNGKCLTLKQLSDYFNVSYQVTNQILNSGLNNIRKELYNLKDDDINNMFSPSILEKTKKSYLSDCNLNYRKNIYEVFSKFDKEDIKYVIDNLLDFEERRVIYSTYGEKLNEKCSNTKKIYRVLPVVEDKLIDVYLSKKTSSSIIFSKKQLSKALNKLKNSNIKAYSTLFKWLNNKLKLDKSMDDIYVDLSEKIFEVKNETFIYSKKIR